MAISNLPAAPIGVSTALLIFYFCSVTTQRVVPSFGEYWRAAGSSTGSIFTTRSMQPATAPGVRLFSGEFNPDCIGWEVGYLGGRHVRAVDRPR